MLTIEPCTTADGYLGLVEMPGYEQMFDCWAQDPYEAGLRAIRVCLHAMEER